MKKLLSFFLALTLVFCVGLPALADTATLVPGTVLFPPNKVETPDTEPSQEAKSVAPVVTGFLICLMEDDTVYQFVPLEEVTNVPYEQGDLLTPDKRVAFKEAYDQAKASVPEGSKLRQVYWFEVPEHYTIDDEHYGKYLFACKGDDVEVTCNGFAMEVVPVTGQTTYFAKITERGVIAISSK